MTNPEDAVYPRNYPGDAVNAKDPDAMYWARQYHGLTKREYFAALALQGILANGIANERGFTVDGKDKTVPEFAVFAADFLISELNK